MITLAKAMLEAARILTNVVESVATGGSATTLVDSGFPYMPDGSNVPANDYFNAGTIWFLSGAIVGTADAVQKAVTDWDKATKTFTFATGTAIAAAVRYAVCDRGYPGYVLEQGVIQALKALGNVPQIYENAALVTVADQEAYTLPAGVYNLKRVEVAQETSSPYDYLRSYQWEEIGDVDGVGSLRFDRGFEPEDAGYRIRLWYQAEVDEANVRTYGVPDVAPVEYVRWAAAAHALRWRLQRVKLDELEKGNFFQEALGQAEKMAIRFRPQIGQMGRDPHFGNAVGADDSR